MELIKEQWIGNWTNFENYIESENEYMKSVWAEAEKFASTMPMFKNGVKVFWQMACVTVTEENTEKLDGWKISESENGLLIEWIGKDGKSLGCFDYVVDRIIEKGLEGKENFLFRAVNAAESCPFTYVLAMEPMPERNARLRGDYISHFHFQFASTAEKLVKDNVLVNKMWYATMCEGDGTVLEQCNVVRGLHRLQRWVALPDRT